MAADREEAYEVNLGNKQLLALFFIVTGFFALFFCAGYMIGFGHGGDGEPGLVQVEEPEPAPPEPALPATLRQEPPEPTPVAAVQPKPAPKPPPPQAKPAEPKPAPPKPKPAPKRTAPEKPSPAAVAEAQPPPKPAPAKRTSGGPDGGYYLQVAALRTQADAAQLAGKLRSRGYPATVNAGQGDGWQRVVVGPFANAEAAQSFKSKLTQDGFDTMLKKL